MFKNKKISVLIPAAGKGKRMGSSLGKQFFVLNGKPIIIHALDCFQSSKEIDCIVIVADAADINKLKALVNEHNLTKVCEIVPGGPERQDSVWNGLNALRSLSPDFVLIHDAVRPFVTHRMIISLLEVAVESLAAIAAVRLKDTVKNSFDGMFISETPHRENLWLAQTPQAFDYNLICRAFEKAYAEHFYGTDDASLVERIGVRVRIVEGSYRNIKITTPEDFEVAQSLARC
ncbi:MAG: 2-C-methyl-D-erythritol 4-phosphate cytidylyltransferase [Bacteroidota bacterium]|nr:2-C-methyl-D-erythritol 4-phosphate cytidylyltransferase [Bacteroidota bacterium]